MSHQDPDRSHLRTWAVGEPVTPPAYPTPEEHVENIVRAAIERMVTKRDPALEHVLDAAVGRAMARRGWR